MDVMKDNFSQAEDNLSRSKSCLEEKSQVKKLIS